MANGLPNWTALTEFSEEDGVPGAGLDDPEEKEVAQTISEDML